LKDGREYYPFRETATSRDVEERRKSKDEQRQP